MTSTPGWSRPRSWGGDFYDYYMIDRDHLALIIADVSGKGIPAAMFMMASKIMINNRAKSRSHDPAKILKAVNKQIMDNNASQMFVTLWMGILEISTGKLAAANAGHEYPCLRQRGGTFELFKDKHSLVLGAMEDTEFTSYELQLEPGDSLFVYTDGVTEATNGAEELFGVKGGAVFLVDELQTADDLRQVVQRHTDHAAHRQTVFFQKRALKPRVRRGLRETDGLTGCYNETLRRGAQLHAEIGQVHRPDMKHGDQPAGLAVQQPDYPGLTLEHMDKHFQAPGQSRFQVFFFQQLLI